MLENIPLKTKPFTACVRQALVVSVTLFCRDIHSGKHNIESAVNNFSMSLRQWSLSTKTVPMNRANKSNDHTFTQPRSTACAIVE